MAERQAAPEAKDRAAVLGVRVTAVLRTSIKVEAARRGITIAELFEEMWRSYLEQQHDRQH
ncbi:hypothetical protein [Mesorhizobium sp.]|uniref:hypothetical protein n=1 Tax=Mesorhizobium sp. TaxID=1871066 RepID=UPI000FE5FF14|nr:hypothetical protein [Mesorhizobium sp.]RWP67755.1 MAG: hypothetical protein EOR09_32015 [Mesorhizobium sp.]